MLNPLTRGKAVKMMRRLLGISSLMHAVDPVTSGGYRTLGSEFEALLREG